MVFFQGQRQLGTNLPWPQTLRPQWSLPGFSVIRSTITAPIQKVLFDPNAPPKTLLAVGVNHRQMGFGFKGTTCWGAVWPERRWG